MSTGSRSRIGWQDSLVLLVATVFICQLRWLRNRALYTCHIVIIIASIHRIVIVWPIWIVKIAVTLTHPNVSKKKKVWKSEKGVRAQSFPDDPLQKGFEPATQKMY
ncbi:hypothetical protein BJV82DRAFT_619062 [Fennellomyces sp. T-0311]|nr:hypothetical protein BJV82DRAFT_619062 [Fennellomyces sp. T-0311]